MAHVVVNPIFAKYKLACTFSGCGGQRVLELGQSCGLQVGDMVPPSFGPADEYGCPRCRRAVMRVIEAPPLPLPQEPKGFVRLPE